MNALIFNFVQEYFEIYLPLRPILRPIYHWIQDFNPFGSFWIINIHSLQAWWIFKFDAIWLNFLKGGSKFVHYQSREIFSGNGITHGFMRQRRGSIRGEYCCTFAWQVRLLTTVDNNGWRSANNLFLSF